MIIAWHFTQLIDLMQIEAALTDSGLCKVVSWVDVLAGKIELLARLGIAFETFCQRVRQLARIVMV